MNHRKSSSVWPHARVWALGALLSPVVACDADDAVSPGGVASGGDTDSATGASSAGTSGTDSSGAGTNSASAGSAGTSAGSTGGESNASSEASAGGATGTSGTGTDTSGSTGGGSEGTSGDSETGAPLGPNCSSALEPAANGTFVALCAVDGTVGHVQLRNLVVPPMHASTQVFLGMDAAPAGPQAPLAPGQFKLLFYGGAGGAPPPIVQVVFGATAVDLELDGGFLAAPSTVCFDVHDGAADLAPALVLWVEGVAGADCADPSTLTVASAAEVVGDVGGEPGPIAAGTSYARQSAGDGVLAIELRNAPVTLRADVAAAAGP